MRFLFPEQSGALFSICRRYRYRLWRSWDTEKPLVAFIGLNPSTADETLDDPTIRRCIGFARDWGFGGMAMLNIFAFRATDPKVMKAAADPIGPANDVWLAKTAGEVSLTVACWGSHGSHLDRGAQVLRSVLTGPLKCFGLTAGGQPKHPLYLARTCPLVEMAR